MNKVFAWAAVCCLTASGCAGTGLLGKKGGQACHITQSQAAPRPQIMRDACMCTCGGLFGGLGKKGCCGDDCCEAPCCADGCCASGCCGDCSSGGLFGGRCSMGDRAGRFDERCRRAVGNVAGGLCGNCNDGCGLCRSGRCNPHAGGYPEPQMYNAGPPTAQTAYPYYTTRGPRDFLQANPTRIGPY